MLPVALGAYAAIVTAATTTSASPELGLSLDVVVEVFVGANCTGKQRRVKTDDLLHGNHDNGWGACGSAWDDGTAMRWPWWGSYRVAAGHAIMTGSRCYDSSNNAYPEYAEVGMTSEAGCVSPDYTFTYVSLPLPPPSPPPLPPPSESPPQLISTPALVIALLILVAVALIFLRQASTKERAAERQVSTKERAAEMFAVDMARVAEARAVDEQARAVDEQKRASEARAAEERATEARAAEARAEVARATEVRAADAARAAEALIRGASSVDKRSASKRASPKRATSEFRESRREKKERAAKEHAEAEVIKEAADTAAFAVKSMNRVAVEAAAQVFGDDVYDSSALRTILQRVDREK